MFIYTSDCLFAGPNTELGAIKGQRPTPYLKKNMNFDKFKVLFVSIDDVILRS